MKADKTADAAKLLAQIQANRGHVRPWHELMARVDPEFLIGHEKMMAASRADDSPLPRKMRELILFASAISMDAHADTVASHAQMAREQGATEAEMLAAVELVIIVRYAKNMRVGVSAILDSAKTR